MKASRIVICALVLGLIVLVWQATTFLSTSVLPRGVVISWHVEHGITSGEVMMPLDFLLAHCTPARFVAAGNTVIRYPTGVMPYHEPVIGSRYRFAVDSPSMGTKTIYLIDEYTASMVPVTSGNFDIRGIGDDIGSSVAHFRDSGKALGDMQQLVITHVDIYETVEALINIQTNAIVSVRVVRKTAANASDMRNAQGFAKP